MLSLLIQFICLLLLHVCMFPIWHIRLSKWAEGRITLVYTKGLGLERILHIVHLVRSDNVSVFPSVLYVHTYLRSILEKHECGHALNPAMFTHLLKRAKRTVTPQRQQNLSSLRNKNNTGMYNIENKDYWTHSTQKCLKRSLCKCCLTGFVQSSRY